MLTSYPNTCSITYSTPCNSVFKPLLGFDKRID